MALGVRIYHGDVGFVPASYFPVALPKGFRYSQDATGIDEGRLLALTYFALLVAFFFLYGFFPRTMRGWSLRSWLFWFSSIACMMSASNVWDVSKVAQPLVGHSFHASGIREPILSMNVLFISPATMILIVFAWICLGWAAVIPAKGKAKKTPRKRAA